MEEKWAQYGRYAADGAAATDDRAERSARSTDAGQDQAFVVLDACHALIEQYLPDWKARLKLLKE